MKKFGKNQVRGLVLCLVSTAFALTETAYFGFNFTPRTTPEVLCDLIVAIMLVASFYLVYIKRDKSNGGVDNDRR